MALNLFKITVNQQHLLKVNRKTVVVPELVKLPGNPVRYEQAIAVLTDNFLSEHFHLKSVAIK
jgi:rRNA processing protein Krr1/Pno1